MSDWKTGPAYDPGDDSEQLENKERKQEMRSSPIVVGVTPCCGNIMRTSTSAISMASHELDEGVCPDCELILTEGIEVHRQTITQKVKRWFRINARVIGGRWQWNANDAFVAYVEIHQIENGE